MSSFPRSEGNLVANASLPVTCDISSISLIAAFIFGVVNADELGPTTTREFPISYPETVLLSYHMDCY